MRAGAQMNLAVVGLAVVGGVALSAQAPAPADTSLAFEVASVRPSPPDPPRGIPVGGLRLPPGRWRAMRLTLVQLIGAAYPEYAFEGRVIGGPDWVRKDIFDIEATMDPRIHPEDAASLVARLLADRFALRTRIERRPVDVYLLKMARDDGRWGPQLKRSDPACVETKKARQVLPRECRGTASGGLNLPVSQIAELLRYFSFRGMDRPVVDHTGLSDYFDFQLSYQCAPFNWPFVSRPCRSEEVSLFTALQEQLGLKLEPSREVVDVLVIVSVEMPTPN
jgi:uncharacterized protein (TIGR03435 family)